MSLREDTVSALAYSFGAERAAQDPARFAAPYNDLARFTQAELARLPDYLRPPLAVLTVFFDAAGLARGGLFHRQPPEKRLRQIRTWRESRFGFCRDFIRLHEGLAALALHSR